MEWSGVISLLIPVILFSLAYTEDLQLSMTNIEMNLRSKCDEKSIIQEIWANANFTFQFSCSSEFQREYFVDWSFQMSMANQTKELYLPNGHWYIEWINGSLLMVVTAIVKKPDECAGDRFKVKEILLSKSEDDCYTTGVSQLDFALFNITIDGKCTSMCDNIEGSIKLDPAINKDGPVTH